MSITSKFNSKYGFSKFQNIEKLVLHLILVVKLADIWDFMFQWRTYWIVLDPATRGTPQLVCDVF